MNDFLHSPQKFIPAGIVIIFLILIFFIGFSTWQRWSTPSVDRDAYQIVILDNQQQYFGHLRNLDTKYPYLSDVYFVRGDSNPANITLLRLIQEIHGPEDILYLNPKHLVWWQNLRKDSKIVQSIYQEKTQRSAQPAR